MSSVMHPVGPEPSETYWVRRAIIIGVALVLVIVLLAALFNRNAGQQPAPAAAPGSSTPTPLTLPSSSAGSPSPSGSASGDPASASGTPDPSTTATGSSKAHATSTSTSSASGHASSHASSTASSTTSAKASPTATASSTSKTSTHPTSSSSSTPSPATATNQQTLVVCNPAMLRPTLTAPSRTIQAKKSLTFSLSLINGSTSTCVVTLKSTDFQLKIFSGKDRIWSTTDCVALVKPQLAEIKPEQAIAWQISWNGRRSAQGCGTRSEIPRAGTYWATAQFTGSKPVRFRFLVK